MNDDDKRPEAEADKLYERTVKNLLNTPPEKKRGGRKPKQSSRERRAASKASG